jgi:hypothetical protein
VTIRKQVIIESGGDLIMKRADLVKRVEDDHEERIQELERIVAAIDPDTLEALARAVERHGIGSS